MYEAHCNEEVSKQQEVSKPGPLWQGKPGFLFQIVVKEQYAFLGMPANQNCWRNAEQREL